jgi:hypothetical protein
LRLFGIFPVMRDLHLVPRRPLALLLLLAAPACFNPTWVEGSATGAFAFDFKVSTTEPGSGTLPTSGNRDVAPLFLLLGGIDATSSVACRTCPTPTPTMATMQVALPPALVYAGEWKAPQASLALETGQGGVSTQAVAAWDFSRTGSALTLTFDEPSFSGLGTTVMVGRGTLKAQAPELNVTGRFNLEYRCHLQEQYFRFCGNTQREGVTNPVQRGWTENTCPAELVAPYEATPTWSGNTVTLGDQRVECRETEGTADIDGKRTLLCHQRREGVKAGGCTWRVHVLTDGTLQQLAVAGWADAACPLKACNTYR